MDDEIVSMKTAQASDGVAVLHLLQQLQTETDVVLIAHLNTMGVAKVTADLHQLSDRDDAIALLAMNGKTPIGILTVTPTEEGRGELGVAVLKNYWHNGIGTMLVDEAIYWFNHYSSLSQLTLDVFSDNNRAHAIYERLGFQEVGRRQTNDFAGKLKTAIEMVYLRSSKTE